MFNGYEPVEYFDALERQITKIEVSGKKIVRLPSYGRSVWVFVAEELTKMEWDRAKDLSKRIKKLMK